MIVHFHRRGRLDARESARVNQACDIGIAVSNKVSHDALLFGIQRQRLNLLKTLHHGPSNRGAQSRFAKVPVRRSRE
ncbi:MAG TPA: hypothetical protein VFT61_06255 [Sphingomicrobium sp.]|nr:hypothetical protein [Sphingomicrobium sp.]